MDVRYDAAILYETLLPTLQPQERGGHAIESAATPAEENDTDPDWHKPESMD